MSSLKEQIKRSVTESMKARTAERTQTLRLALTAIQKKEMDTQKDLDDAEVQKTLQTMIKQLNEALDQAKSANRADLVSKAEGEILIIKEFLPQQLSEVDVQKIVDEIVAKLKSGGTLPAGAAAVGMVMKSVMPVIGSKAEGKVIQAAVRKSLGL